MPTPNKDRDYKKEYARDHKAKKDKLDRAARNKANRAAKKKGTIKKGDGKDVDHIDPLSKGGSRGLGNTRVVSRKTNRKKSNK